MISQPKTQLLKVVFGSCCWSLMQMIPHDGEANTLHHKAEFTVHFGDGFHTVIWTHHYKGVLCLSDNNPLDPYIFRTPRSSNTKKAAKIVNLPDSVLEGFCFRVPGIPLPATFYEVADMEQLLGIALP